VGDVRGAGQSPSGRPAEADTWLIAGRYRLAAPIGRGAMGVVWRARDELLDREVAIKQVQLAPGLSEAERENVHQRTLREARAAARISHPAVVAVYDVAEEFGRPWIVMELVHGRSLDRVIKRRGGLPPERAAEVGSQLLAALAVAHAGGVLHRDVKPGNVLLTRDGRAVLTDFGIAALDGDPSLTQTGMLLGSPAFTAPERIRGEVTTPAADLWSLGATLYAAVEGEGPYDRYRGATATMAAVISDDPPPPKTVGPLAAVIMALLSRDPAARPSAPAAARMLEAAVGGRARASSHRRTRGRSLRSARWTPARAVAAAAACLIAFLGVCFWALDHHQAAREGGPTPSKSITTSAATPGKRALHVLAGRRGSSPSPASTPSPRSGGTIACATFATADISADCYARSSGAISVSATADMSPRGVDSKQLEQLSNGDYLEYPGINFGSGSSQFDVRVASGASNGVSGTVEIVLDNPSNAPVASVSVASTGGWTSWETVPANLQQVTGTHTVYIEFSSDAVGNPPYVSLHYFTFPVP